LHGLGSNLLTDELPIPIVSYFCFIVFLPMLHLQVTSLRRGMWDSIYDNFQMTSLSDTTNTGSGNQVGEINPIENSELSKTQHVMPPTHCEYIYVLYLHLLLSACEFR